VAPLTHTAGDRTEGGGPGVGSVGRPAPRSRRSAAGGKTTTDSRPAHTSAAPLTGESSPSSMPICVAVTMNGSDVACSRPAANAARRPAVGTYSTAGATPQDQQRQQQHRHPEERRRLVEQAAEASRTPLETKNTGITNP